MKEPNLVDVIEHLTPKQRAFLLGALQRWIEKHEHIHAGLLPFVSAQDAVMALSINIGMLTAIPRSPDGEGSRVTFISNLISVIRQHTPHSNITLAEDTVRLILSDYQILKRFKKHNQRVCFALPTKPEVQVYLTKVIGKVNVWDVVTMKPHLDLVTTWLVDNLR